MSNEKQTDSLHWKNKLEDLNSLPGEEKNDKNASWEKLHGRLHEKRRHNKIAWYWIAAAACSLLALIIPRMIITKKENGWVKITTQQKQEKNAPAPHSSITRKEPVVISPSLSMQKNQPIKNIDKRNLNSSSPANKNDNTKKDEPLIANLNTAIETIPGTAINTIPADTPAAITTAAIVKKKLRVVHINELEATSVTIPDQLALSANHEQNNFKFRFQNIHPVNPPATARQEYAALKIPLTN